MGGEQEKCLIVWLEKNENVSLYTKRTIVYNDSEEEYLTGDEEKHLWFEICKLYVLG